MAAGNTTEEATLHALLELVERDALDRSTISDRNKVALDDIEGDCRTAIAMVQATGATISLYRLAALHGTHAFACYIRQPEMPHVFGGSGCHLLQGIAIERAVLESIQSRISIISGLRDDIPPWMYDGLERPPHRLDQNLGHVERLRCGPERRWTLNEAIVETIKLIHKHTKQSVIAIELQRDATAFPTVVQVFAPGLNPSRDMKMPILTHG
ncbi:YcaO-like family protein [Rhizobium leguminosarum]|nr:YcaO-like family protein [Rhizobium leguminosarum]